MKKLSSGFINTVFGGALYIPYPEYCFYGHSFSKIRAADLPEASRKEMAPHLARIVAWRTQDGWYVLGKDKKHLWRLNIPLNFVNPVIGKTFDNFLTYRNKTKEIVIEAEKISLAELQLKALFL